LNLPGTKLVSPEAGGARTCMAGKRDRASKDALAHLWVRYLKEQGVMVFPFVYLSFG